MAGVRRVVLLVVFVVASAAAQAPSGEVGADVAAAEKTGFDLLLGREGVARDPAQAAVWLERAAAAGRPNAAAVLAAMYQRGAGVQQDLTRARGLAMQAAEHGVASALAQLGAERAFGSALSARDPAAGIHWLIAAAEQGEPFASFVLGQLYRYGDGVATDRDLGRQLVLRSAELGYPPASVEAAALLLGADPAPEDVARALFFTRFAASASFAPGAYQLGKLYLAGRHLERDVGLAAQWLTRASDLGYPPASLWLAELYAKGVGVTSDASRAAELRERALPSLSVGQRNELAWELAVSADAQARNGALAVQIMEAVPSSQLAPAYIDTLAAAYAEAGRFDDAVDAQLRAIAAWPAEAPAPTRASLEERLALYRAGAAYREER